MNSNESTKNHITITVITTEGNHTDDYNPNNKLEKVVKDTIKALELIIDESQYELVKVSSTTPLDLSLKIETVGLLDNDKLEYRIRNAGGGERA